MTNVNEKWCKLFGYTKEEVIGNPIFDFIHGDEQVTAESSFHEKIHSKKPYTGGHERTYVTKNGEPRVFVINDFLSFDETGALSSPYIPPWRISPSGKKLKRNPRKAHYWLEKRVEERTWSLQNLTRC